MARDHIAVADAVPDSTPTWAFSPTHASVERPVCTTGNDSASCPRSSSMAGAIFLSVSLIALIVVIFALICAMKKALNRTSDGGSSTHSTIERGLPADGSNEESIIVDAMGDTRLVLLPGDETPHIVAIPSYIPLNIVIETSSSSTAAEAAADSKE
ncbi:hypothetical protein KP509_31G057600 [Ceratopteris richardii]|uniref:Transmembrane protein n=1 Tax=Ceratopteris richardii TaxID=49495 RepID=A0A8T2R090_CERRI|nr:hypothetical protein KP509_31G057600 [Ceratopteris richardii]